MYIYSRRIKKAISLVLLVTQSLILEVTKVILIQKLDTKKQVTSDLLSHLKDCSFIHNISFVLIAFSLISSCKFLFFFLIKSSLNLLVILICYFSKCTTFVATFLINLSSCSTKINVGLYFNITSSICSLVKISI